MIKIRLSRYGIKKKPFYHITVADSRRFRNAKFIEKIGYYNPLLKKNISNNFFIKKKNFYFWIKNGAKISKRVKFLVKKFNKVI